MNVLSLFDGMSGARLALDMSGIKVNKYYASEIDKYAIKIAQKNYPDTVQLGSVTDIPDELLKTLDIDLLIGGSPCFVAGTKVLTEVGYKNIEDIVIGDNVLTHKGKFKKVKAIGGKTTSTVTLHCQGIKPTGTTLNHPYYVRHKNRVWNNTKRRYDVSLSKAKWVNVGDLRLGDMLGMKINTESKNVLDLTAEECYVLGRYIADGHTRKDYRASEGRPNHRHWQLILSLGSHKVDAFYEKITSLSTSCYAHTNSVHRVVFSNKRLVEIAEKYLGCGARNKRIPIEFVNLPTDLLKELLKGYMDGDGSVRDGVFRATSISEQLIIDLSSVVAKVYKTNSSYEHTIRPTATYIEGRYVNQNDTYTITFRTEMKKQSNAVVEGGYVWLRFKKVEPRKSKEQVYNLEVKSHNSYTANNAIVHNCQGFSLAGHMKGMATSEGVEVTTLEQYLELKSNGFEFDGQSYLFWEFIRVLHIVKPKYFLLENVRVQKKWKDIFDNVVGTPPILINSSLLSPQNRERYYWTNIPNVEQPTPTNLVLNDILLEGEGALLGKQGKVVMRDNTEKSACVLARDYKGFGNQGMTTARCNHIADAIDIKGHDLLKRVYAVNGKSPAVNTCSGGNRHTKVLTIDGEHYRRLLPIEHERLQMIPDNYTEGVSNTQRYKMIGNGFTITVISHILNNIKNKREK